MIEYNLELLLNNFKIFHAIALVSRAMSGAQASPCNAAARNAAATNE
jgi:hypothetical protein